jgi:hypothetical protein
MRPTQSTPPAEAAVTIALNPPVAWVVCCVLATYAMEAGEPEFGADLPKTSSKDVDRAFSTTLLDVKSLML